MVSLKQSSYKALKDYFSSFTIVFLISKELRSNLNNFENFMVQETCFTKTNLIV